jgi:hypothetical protein
MAKSEKPNFFAQFKNRCAGCRKAGLKMTKEHLFPRWLIERSGTAMTGIRWLDRKWIPANAATIPLCAKCNKDFGKILEVPVSQIFNDLESDRGLSDAEAEILVKWLWKFEGLAWIFNNPDDIYTKKYTLAERVLRPIDEIRGSLVLAIGMIDKIDPSFGDAPMGIDSYNLHNAIFVAGVFLKVAIMVLLKDFALMVPSEFSQYNLAEKPSELANAKLFYPKVGFRNDIEAVIKTLLVAKTLSSLHDDVFIKLKQI